MVGLFAGPFGGVYAATKHSMEALSASMRMELRRYGIRVVVVNPGLTETDLHRTAFSTLSEFSDKSDYKKWYQGYMHRHENGAPAGIAAQVISNIVAETNPKLRYVIGNRECRVLLLRKILPEGLFYSLVEKRAMKTDSDSPA